MQADYFEKIWYNLSMIKIRIAHTNDIDFCDKIARRCREELPFISRVQFASSIEKEELLLAEEGGEIVGFLRFHKRRDNLTTIYDLAISPDYRRQGIASRLIHYLDAPLRVKTTEENGSALALYKRLGFIGRGIISGKKRNLVLLETTAPHMFYVRGGEKRAALACKLAGAGYGVRSDYKYYAQPFMFDIDWNSYKWEEYLRKVKIAMPVQAMVADYERPDQRDSMLNQVEDLRKAGVLKIMVCPKFEEAIEDIPDDCILAISVPTEYGGFLPLQSLKGKRIHLLGGHPDQWSHIIWQRYPDAKFISIDGNVAGRRARYGEVWADRWSKAKFSGTYEELVAFSINNAREYIREYKEPIRAGKRVRRCYA